MEIHDCTKQKDTASVKRNNIKVTDTMRIVTTKTRVEIWSSDRFDAKLLAVAAVKNSKDFDSSVLLEIAKYDFASGIIGA